MTSRILGAIFLGLASSLSAQTSVSAKFNLLFPGGNTTWQNINTEFGNIYKEKGKNQMGFNFGLSLKTSLVNNFFIMPEIYYTTFKNEFTDPVTNTKLEAKSNRVDVPILFGVNVLAKNAGIFVGPVGSYQLSVDDQYNDFKENAKNNFTIGYQLGAQLKIKKLIFSGKYESAFNNDQREYINDAVTLTSGDKYTVRYDNRQSLLLLGLGYEF